MSDRLHSDQFSQELIANLSSQFKQLVSDNWLEIWACRPLEPDSPIRAAVVFEILPAGSEYHLSSKLSFSLKYRHRADAKVTYGQKGNLAA